MSQEFEYFLQYNEILIQKARIMNWIEDNYDDIKKNGALCRAMVSIAIHGGGSIEKVADKLNLDKTTVSDYLKQLVTMGILTSEKEGRINIYMPKHENGKKVKSL